MKIDYAVMTVDRPGAYIHQTLNSLGLDFNAKLIAGSPSIKYLEPYFSRKNFEILAPSVEEWTNFSDRPIMHKASWNYWRCLQLGKSSEDSEGLVIFEDDVEFAKGWQPRLEKTISTIKQKHGEAFVLALYTAHPIPVHEYINGALYWGYPYNDDKYDCFYGTQGMYFPEKVRSTFAEAIKIYGVDTSIVPYDILLKLYMMATKVPLFVTMPCLIQHIGKNTSGLGNFHEASGFLPELFLD